VQNQGDRLRQPSAPADDHVEFDFMEQEGELNTDESQELSESDLPNQEEPPSAAQHQHPEATRRSTRQTVPTRRLIETACAVLDDTDAVEDYETQEAAEDPMAFAAGKSDPDTLNFKDAMNAEDSRAFKKAMMEEANAHADNDQDVPSDQDILPSVWAFRRKRRILSRAVCKHKARLNVHGGMQKHGVNC
jgi:hypothetical protein